MTHIQTPFVQLQDVALHYRSRQRDVVALNGVSFSIEAGSRIAITGPSGSGKSSLLSLLGGFNRPSAGRCLVQGRDLHAFDDKALCDYRANILGFVFQNHALLPHLSLIENVMLGVEHLPKEHALWLGRAQSLLDQVGLAGMHHSRPSEVSGGQAQRAGIARALLRQPKLILADEPTGSLDGETAQGIIDLLLQVCGGDSALMLVTHSPEIAQRMDRQIHIQAGRVVQDQALAGSC